MRRKIILILLLSHVGLMFSQLEHYNWPTNSGQAVLSDKYQVFVKHGSGVEEEVEVLMSEADPNDIKYDFKESELSGRTFSFASLSYNKATGSGLTFRIVKKFGNNSISVKIAPKSYNITPTVTSNQVTFSINDNNKFISVNFEDTENETASEKWIKHMLTIFIDPEETSVPNTSNSSVIVYNNSLNPTTLRNAGTIYFPPGYYNLKDYQFNTNSIIDSEGKLTLQNGQDIYLAGGAFVEGLILRENFNDVGQKIYGRGVLSGKQYPWQDSQGNKIFKQIIELGRFAEVNGIHVIDSPLHGIVAPNNMTISNLKFLGWHSNNDAVRVGQDSEIKNSFIRAVDDFFYNFDNYVHDCVLWVGHNGAVLTYGWGGDGGNTYNSGASTLDNIDIINPEWTGLGNNNGLVASQTGLDYKPFAYNNSSTLTTVQNIRIEGKIPGLLNLKPRSNGGTPIAVQVSQSKLGYLGDLLLKNITVESQFGKSRIKGQTNATITGNNTYFVQNVTMTNITINNNELNNISAPVYFEVESSTTQNINFDIGTGSSSSDLTIEDFSNTTITHLPNIVSGVAGSNQRGITNEDINTITAGTGKWFAVDTWGGTTPSEYDFDIQSSGGNPNEYLSRTSVSQFAKGVGYVFNNKGGDAFGILNMSFDFKWTSPRTADRLSYKVYGIQDDENDGIEDYFRLTGGSGAFGDNDATKYVGSDATELAGSNELGVADDWTKVNFTIDVTGYEYIVIVFGTAFGTDINTNNEAIEPIFGLDNVTIPKNIVLSTDNFNTNKLTVFPNPVSNTLNLKNINEIYSYRVLDVSGKQIIKVINQKTNTIDVSVLKRGLYFLEIITENNIKSTVKIIKK